jgi:hypothetical protein
MFLSYVVSPTLAKPRNSPFFFIVCDSGIVLPVITYENSVHFFQWQLKGEDYKYRKKED